jgi:hypothetical protein
MQTFLPFRDFKQCAKVLDNKRLGKQRVECLQLLNKLLGKNTGKAWEHHPALLQWVEYEKYLALYMYRMIEEWKSRGFQNTMEVPCEVDLSLSENDIPWITEELMMSHKSRLLQKDLKFYSQYDWDVPMNLEYVWPKRWNKGKGDLL